MPRTIHITDNKDIQILFGKYDQNLKLIESELNVRVKREERGLKVSGERKQV